ncbi:MAG: glycine cleavage system protein GcvH [Nitriliruptoraceae bacterium]
MDIPEQLHYTADHEWVRIDGDVVTVGITAFAQSELGDVVYVDLPTTGSTCVKDQPFGEVESTKSVSDLFAPVSGEVTEVNPDLDADPGTVNTDPYEAGWLIKIRVADATQLDALLDAEQYRQLVEA